MNDHTVKAYSDELRALDNRIAQMGGLAEMLLGQAFDALEKRDPGAAQDVIERDREIDDIQRQLEELTVQMIAMRQPMANDLRQIMGSLRVAADLERIGDLAKNIAKRAATISNQTYPLALVAGIRHMVELALRQLGEVLTAYADRDAELAVRVWEGDEKLDLSFNSTFRELLTYMMEDPRTISHCTHLLFVAKNVERIGDHTTNIAETVVFLVRGRALVEERPKSDNTSTTVVGAKSPKS